MTDPHTGLPADNISGPLGSPRRSGYTSPTNIGGYLWSAVVARELGIISARECGQRLTKTLTTMARLAGRREGTNPNPTWGDGVVTPHATFLAMQYESRQAYDNLVKIERDLKAHGQGGFYDAVAVKSGLIAKRYLSLDQAMVLGAIGNVFCDNVIRRNFIQGEVQTKIRPLIGIEEFGAGVIS